MHPIYNLVFEGGGAKGTAYLGALEVLSQNGTLSTVNQVAGASAGAIAAFIIGLGFDLEAMQSMLGIDFKQFKDGNIARNALNVINSFGFFPGDKMRAWAADLAQKQLAKPNATFADLHTKVLSQANKDALARYRDLHIIGANLSTQQAEIFSYYTTPDMPIADALRISMSVPFAFKPRVHKKLADGSFVKDTNGALITDQEGQVYADGGLIENYPITLFDNGYPNPHTLGLRVDDGNEIANLRDKKPAVAKPINNIFGFGMAIISSAMAAQNKAHIQDCFRTIYIDIGNISTLEFALNNEQKQALLQAGREATKRFFTKAMYINKRDIGFAAVTDYYRLQKQDRYKVYEKANAIYTADLACGLQLQCSFISPPDTPHWQLQAKIGQYYQRLTKQPWILSIQHARQLDGSHLQILIFLLDKCLRHEFADWCKKYAPDKNSLPAPIDITNIIILQQRTANSRPSWMTISDKQAIYKQKLFTAISIGDIKEVMELLQQGIPLTYKDNKGNSPLHLALQNPRPELISLLLEYGRLQDQNDYGDTPLHYAAQHDREGSAMLLLLAQGALVNVQNKQGATPLMVAVRQHNLTAVNILLDHGTDLNIKDSNGFTALSKAQNFANEHQDGLAILLALQKAMPQMQSSHLLSQFWLHPHNQQDVSAEHTDIAKDQPHSTYIKIGGNPT